METKELCEKVKNGKASYEELYKWCNENKEKMNLNDYDEWRLYTTLVDWSMKARVENLNKDEIDIYIRYFANKTAKELQLDNKVVVEVLEREQFREKYGEDSYGMCSPNDDDTYNVSYNISKLYEHLMSEDKNKYKFKFLFVMQTIFHEMQHVTQNVVILQDSKEFYKKSVYIMAMETITRKISPKFYKENYNNLLKENNANKVGLQKALRTIQSINPELYVLYNQKGIKKQMNVYDENFYDGEFEIFQTKGDTIKSLDAWTDFYVTDHPEILQRYPILKIKYNEDGKQKDILQMLRERERLVQSCKKNEIDDLYEVAMNRKFFEKEDGCGTEDELLYLDKYIEETGTEDEFIYDLVRYRLNRGELTEEQIETFISAQKEKASEIRKIKNEEQQEKNTECLIREEYVGDEQEREQKWINIMQIYYSKSTQIEGYSSKQSEVIKSISEQLRKRDDKELDKYLGNE